MFAVPIFALAAMQMAPGYSVAGVRLGNAPDQTKSALLAAGYRIESVKPTDSYAQRLQDARSTELRLPTSKIRKLAIGILIAVREDQRITVRFDDDERGLRVAAEVRYVAADVAHPYSVVRQMLMDRLGPPTKVRPQSSAWCVGGGEDCDAGSVMDEDSIAVRAESDLGRNITTINLRVGAITRREWNLAHRADLKRLVKAPNSF